MAHYTTVGYFEPHFLGALLSPGTFLAQLRRWTRLIVSIIYLSDNGD